LALVHSSEKDEKKEKVDRNGKCNFFINLGSSINVIQLSINFGSPSPIVALFNNGFSAIVSKTLIPPPLKVVTSFIDDP